MAASVSSRTRDLRKYNARHSVLLGYPIAARNFTRDEMLAYFARDTLTCLLCGKEFKNLGAHVVKSHQVTASGYCVMYGLPRGRGLTSVTTKAAMAEAARVAFESSPELRAALKRGYLVANNGGRDPRHPPYHIERMREMGRKYGGTYLPRGFKLVRP